MRCILTEETSIYTTYADHLTNKIGKRSRFVLIIVRNLYIHRVGKVLII
jgi:hypothetical protein